MVRGSRSLKLASPTRNTLRFYEYAALAVLLTAPGVGCSEHSGADTQTPGKTKRPPPTLVRIALVTKENLSPKVIVVGSVIAKRKSVVASGANGVVDRFEIKEGQRVKLGDVLSILRMESSNREIAEARSILAERLQLWKESQSSRPEDIAEAQFRRTATLKTRDKSKEHMLRMKALLASQSVNQDEYDDALERYEVAEALYQAATAGYEKVKRGPRAEKREQARYRHLAQRERVAFLAAEQAKRTTKAPFNGYIVKEHSYVGQWLSKGGPVVTLAMLDEVDVVVNVDQNDLRHVQLGKTAEVSIPGYDLTTIVTKSGRTFSGLLRTESPDSIQLELEDGTFREIPRSDVASRETKPWSGIIEQIVPQSEWQRGSRGFPVKVRVKNRFRIVHVTPPSPPLSKGGMGGSTPPKRRLLPVLKEGMMATVTFRGTQVPMLLVPKDALVRTTQGIKIYLYRAGKSNADMGSTVQVSVETGISLGDRIQVIVRRSEPGEPTEIREGMPVVTEGAERLRPVQGNVKVVHGKTGRKKR